MILTNIMLSDGCQTRKWAKLMSVVRLLCSGCTWGMYLERCTAGSFWVAGNTLHLMRTQVT